MQQRQPPCLVQYSFLGRKDPHSSFPKLYASPKRRETHYFLGVVVPVILQLLRDKPTCVTILGTSCFSCRTFAFGRCTPMESSISRDSSASIFSLYGTERAAIFYARATVASGPFGTTLFICGTGVSLDPSRVCVLPWTRTCQAALSLVMLSLVLMPTSSSRFSATWLRSPTKGLGFLSIACSSFHADSLRLADRGGSSDFD